MEEKKKRYTRYTINGRKVTREDFDKMFDKTKVDFDRMFDTAIDGFDKAMNGIDRAMSGVDKAIDKVDDLASWSFTSKKRDSKTEGDTMTVMNPKRLLYTFVTVCLSVFIIGFCIFFLTKTSKEPSIEPATSSAIEEKTTQETPDVFKKL